MFKFFLIFYGVFSGFIVFLFFCLTVFRWFLAFLGVCRASRGLGFRGLGFRGVQGTREATVPP